MPGLSVVRGKGQDIGDAGVKKQWLKELEWGFMQSN